MQKNIHTVEHAYDFARKSLSLMKLKPDIGIKFQMQIKISFRVHHSLCPVLIGFKCEIMKLPNNNKKNGIQAYADT